MFVSALALYRALRNLSYYEIFFTILLHKFVEYFFHSHRYSIILFVRIASSVLMTVIETSKEKKNN